MSKAADIHGNLACLVQDHSAIFAERLWGLWMVPPTNEMPTLAPGRGTVSTQPLRRSTALRMVELAVLLLRASAILLLLSPFLLLLAWWFG